ncbi:hypothetical protein Vi05172_g3134 [Venturia inaequalis]|nr:hypothetical protein Vi05172_g3134 [Venturia inaequalis]
MPWISRCQFLHGHWVQPKGFWSWPAIGELAIIKQRSREFLLFPPHKIKGRVCSDGGCDKVQGSRSVARPGLREKSANAVKVFEETVNMEGAIKGVIEDELKYVYYF